MKDLKELFEFLSGLSDEEITNLIDKYAKDLVKRNGVGADIPFKSDIRKLDNLKHLIEWVFRDKLPGMIKEKVNEPDKLLTVKEVAERLGVTEPTVYSYIKRGLLRSVRMGESAGRQMIRIDVESLNVFIKSGNESGSV
jgi:excisionase family DNA binding protein